MMRLNKILFCGIASALTLSSLAHADMKISARTTIDDGQPMDTTIYVKEDAVRTEAAISPAMRITSILQCSESQMIQINEKTKTYLVTPIEEEASPGLRSRDSDEAESPKQTTANFVEELRDTGERKDFFRRTARHLTGELASAGDRPACMAYMEASVDGWYIDVPWPACARALVEQQLRSALEGCAEEVHFKVSGGHLGFPVLEDETISAIVAERELTHKIHREVTKIENLPVDARLVQIPSSCREVHTFQELMGAPGGELASTLTGMATIIRAPGRGQQSKPTVEQGTPAGNADAAAKLAQKKPGVLRIGVAQVTSSAAQPPSLNKLQAKIIAGLQAAGHDAVPLTTNPDDHDGLEAEAKTKDCDYYVTSDIGELKESRARGTPRTTAQIVVKAYLPDQIRPVLDGGNDYIGGDVESTLDSLVKEEVRSIATEIKKVRR